VLEELLNSEGAKGVDLYRQSFIDGKRVATGKTNKSVAYEVVKTETSITLTISARKDVNQLEDGVTASQYSSNPATFTDLQQWIDAKGLNRTPSSIDRGLKLSGWSQDNRLGNRTGQNGGTKDIITTPSNKILTSLESKVAEASKDFVVNQINIEL
jgi:hypothetical protein